MSENYPSLSKRFQSIFIDLLFMIALMFLAGWILDKFDPADEGQDGLIRAILFVSIWGVYEPVAMTLGCTVGNLLTKIRVRQFGSIEKRINIFQAYVRFIIKFFLGWLSFITISFNEQKRAIHDLASGTIVLEKN